MFVQQDQAQQYWNSFESKFVQLVDELAPLVPYLNNYITAVFFAAFSYVHMHDKIFK